LPTGIVEIRAHIRVSDTSFLLIAHASVPKVIVRNDLPSVARGIIETPLAPVMEHSICQIFRGTT
jgi:hypothetical protein